jgi:hypothetical protein
MKPIALCDDDIEITTDSVSYTGTHGREEVGCDHVIYIPADDIIGSESIVCHVHDEDEMWTFTFPAWFSANRLFKENIFIGYF